MTDSDCDDGDACTDDTCGPDETCRNTVVDCDDGLICTDDSCDPDPDTGGCTFIDVVCPEGETCVERQGCKTACVTDFECDDLVFCNGDETCVGGECVAATDPCSADETCDESTDSCD